MSKDLCCKDCRRGRCRECRGHRNGNKKLRCMCHHTPAGTGPPRIPQRIGPGETMFDPVELDLARMLTQRELSSEVSFQNDGRKR